MQFSFNESKDFKNMPDSEYVRANSNWNLKRNRNEQDFKMFKIFIILITFLDLQNRTTTDELNDNMLLIIKMNCNRLQ